MQHGARRRGRLLLPYRRSWIRRSWQGMSLGGALLGGVLGLGVGAQGRPPGLAPWVL